jgi:hypothetical protein
LALLVPPTAPSASFSYIDPGYNSQLQQPMFDKLLNDLVYGGYGIDTNDEVALFNRARDREALLTAATVAEVTRQAAGTSFPMPQGSLYAAQQKARQDEMSKMSSVNRDIALKRADLYVENRRKVIEQVLASEQLTMGLYNAIQNRSIQAAQLEVVLAISVFDSSVKLFQTTIESLTSQIEATVAAAAAQVSIYAADVNAYSAFVNAVVGGAQIDIANSKNIFAADMASYQSRVDIIKFQLEQLKTTSVFRSDINKFGTEFFRTGFGSAITGVNGLAVQSGTV